MFSLSGPIRLSGYGSVSWKRFMRISHVSNQQGSCTAPSDTWGFCYRDHGVCSLCSCLIFHSLAQTTPQSKTPSSWYHFHHNKSFQHRTCKRTPSSRRACIDSFDCTCNSVRLLLLNCALLNRDGKVAFFMGTKLHSRNWIL